MIPTGSRLLFGATAVATIGAIAYGISNGGSLGTIGLLSVAVCLAVLAALNLYLRDSTVSLRDEAAVATAVAGTPAPRPSLWPAVGGLSAVLLIVGLVTYPVVLIFGLIGVAATITEWMVEAWSERASGDTAFNTEVRGRFSHPLEFPVLATLVAAVVIYSFSRILLFLSKTGGPVIFGVLAAVILAVGFVFAYRPQIKNGAMYGVAGIAVLGLVTGGVAAGLSGERDIEAHETTGTLADHGECDTAEHTHADKKASQTVAAKANTAADLVLGADDVLVADALGYRESSDTLTLPRSTSTNVLFRNRSDHERRLVLDLGVREVEHEDGETTEEPWQLCTALVEPGGVQLLTFNLGGSSVVGDYQYRFFVPGVDDAAVTVVVP